MDPLSISRIRLKNLKGFEDCDTEFLGGLSSVLVSGDNGNGKSTFLRAIALGLSDQMGAYGLMSELSGSFINYAAKKAVIEIFLNSASGQEYKAKTEITFIDKYGTEHVSQGYFHKNHRTGKFRKIKDDDFPLYDLFCTAYGAGSRTFGKERYNQYYHTDSVYQLFKSDAALTEQELAVRRVLEYRESSERYDGDAIERRQNEIWALLFEVLNLPNEFKISLDNNGIFFTDTNHKDRKGKHTKTELTSMGDGVRAITTMLLDIMSWWGLYLLEIPDDEWISEAPKSEMMTNFKRYHGIVLIDEIELHLHPDWQRKIVGDLLNAFPNVQFIITTHAAICVSGATDIGASERLQFKRVGNGKCEQLFLSDGSSVDDVLHSKAFGLDSTLSRGFEEEVSEINELIVSDIRTEEKKKNLQKRIATLRKENPAQAQILRAKLEHASLDTLIKK